MAGVACDLVFGLWTRFRCGITNRRRELPGVRCLVSRSA